ncbi:glycosyltransferase family protein [Rhodohalobacter halophilus]|uniref:glycosyltransferase family protein n=1 Tax=Rhodohalobacter halophilus TaxID=1812810 RepID=UPI00083F8C47|nr:glycosyltransferase family protein [Rhodohalobacter halophilus]
MRILYGIQGTGHGHISRAKEILPKLTEHASVDVLLSGYNCRLHLDEVAVSRKRGVSLAYNDQGGVSFLETARSLQPVTFLKDVQTIQPREYDLVISDYEPITAWASIQSETPSIGLSHQASFLSEKSPRPDRKSYLSEAVLKYFAPVQHPVGFHFKRYDSFILPPVIRGEIRNLIPVTGNHVTVYLPSYHPDFLAKHFQEFESIEWHIFSPLCEKSYQSSNVIVHPVGNRPFLESLESSRGVIAGAGFELCAESMFLGKKLLAIPIKNQYEQLCNAAALKQMGVHVVYEIDQTFTERIHHWIDDSSLITLDESANIDQLTQLIIRYTGRVHSRTEKISARLFNASIT